VGGVYILAGLASDVLLLKRKWDRCVGRDALGGFCLCAAMVCLGLLIIRYSTRPRLYDNYPNGKEALLLDTMHKSKLSGIPWELVFSEKVIFSLLRSD
jgi:hypothetical protein